MCYSAEAAIRAELDYAIHRGDKADRIAELVQRLQEIRWEKYYHVSGFAHPKIMVFTDKDPYKPQAFNWGLIAPWCKDEVTAKKSMQQCLNARGETIFEKASFKASAKSKRCLVYLDAFYEHHHIGKNTFPFRISLKDEKPMPVAGLWTEWANPQGTGEVINTFTIVTTKGNPLMAKIHNNPKAEMGPRMPVILSKETQDAWLDSKATQKDIEELIKPCDENLLQFHTVNRLNGKAYMGNKPEIREPFKYAEVDWA